MQDQCDGGDFESVEKVRTDQQAKLDDKVNSNAESEEGNAGGLIQERHQDQ